MRCAVWVTLLLAAGCAGQIDTGQAGPANTQTASGPVETATPPGRFGRDSVGDDLLQRAELWVDQGVMYSFAPDYDGYRTDCSGYVSWVWGLPAPGHTTYSLAGGPWDDGSSYQISWDELQPGDALNFPGDVSEGTGHVVLFAGWADGAHYFFYDYEEYNFGHPASYLKHNLDTNWTGAPWRDQYIPIRLTGRIVPAPDPSPMPDPTPSPTGAASCDGLGYFGRCDGPIAEWAEAGQCKLRDCPAEGTTCGYISDTEGYGCLGVSPGGTTFNCSDRGYAGDCRSNWLIWAEAGQCRVQDCSQLGLTCGWRSDAQGNDCL